MPTPKYQFTESLKQYTDLYEAHSQLIAEHSPAFMNACRKAAFAGLCDNGLPTRKVERYKYTNVDAALAPDYGLNLHRIKADQDPYKGHLCSVPHMSTSQYYVTGDVVADPTGLASFLGDGVFVLPFARAQVEYPDLISHYYNKLAGKTYDAISALNSLFVQDGLLIYVKSGVKAECPIQIVNIPSAGADMMFNRRLLIVAEADSECSIIYCDNADSKHRYLSTQVIEVFCEKNSQVDFYGIEETRSGNTRFNNLYVEQQAGSRFSLNDMTLHNGITRNVTDISLVGEGAKTELNGAGIVDGDKRIDTNILVDHLVSNCESTMLYKNVLNEHSVVAFAGKVLVREGAVKTQSEQTNANLCAGNDARAYSQPMLEIYADDVKCNHGSTVGKLDEMALFYMRQRGIEEAEARLLLQHAFLNDVIDHVRLVALRDRLSFLVDQRFRGRMAKDCHGCSLCS